MTSKTVPILLLLATSMAFSTICRAQTPLQISAQADSLQCHSDDDGELSWLISGGEGPYSYEWRRLGSSFVFSGGTQMDEGAGGPIGGNLEANTYVITVEDNTGEIALDTIEIGEPERILVLDIAISDALCAESCDGWVNLTVGGGTGQLTTSWNDDEVGASRENLCPGEYVFFIIDERGCRQKGSIPISAPPPIEVVFTENSPTCSGATNGTLTAAANGGLGELQYNWSNGDEGPQLSNANSASYQLSITDEGGCVKEFNTFLPDGPPLDANVQVNYGCGDGNLIVSTLPINGSGPYSYQWSTGSSAPLLFQMSSGQYGLSLTDGNGCVDQVSFELDFVAPLMVDAQVQNVSCPGAADGGIVLNVSGGLPPYELLWNDDLSGLEPSSLSGGEYGYNINASGCGLAGNVLVSEPQSFELNLSFAPQSDDLLMATAFVSGGTFPYQYQWSNGNSGMTASNLVLDQVYTLIVTDVNGCQEVWEIQASLTDVEDVEYSDMLSVYPNPSSDIFWIAHEAGGVYQIYDAQGKMVSRGETSSRESVAVDLQDFPAGSYHLEFLTPKGRFARTLIKQ